jgi:hypothetical protein
VLELCLLVLELNATLHQFFNFVRGHTRSLATCAGRLVASILLGRHCDSGGSRMRPCDEGYPRSRWRSARAANSIVRVRVPHCHRRAVVNHCRAAVRE